MSVRAQVFEVIVRQALAGAPWREICAGPMAVNNITEEQIDAEVNRRIELLTLELEDSERAELDRYFERHEQEWRLPAENTSALESQIRVLVSQLYETLEMPPPYLALIHSPASMVAYLNAVVNRKSTERPSLDELCAEQDQEFSEFLEKQLSTIAPNTCDLGEALTTRIVTTLTLNLKDQNAAFSDSANTNACALLEEKMRSKFLIAFRQRLTPLLTRYSDTYDIALAQLTDESVQFLSNMDTQSFFAQTPLQQLRDQMWGRWRNIDLLGNELMDRIIQNRAKTKLITNRRVQILLSLMRLAPWFSFYENFCFVGSQPKEVVRDIRLRISNEDGPAITFADGYKVFAVSGLVTPRKFLESRNSITVEDIKQEENVERRRGLIELYGTARYLTDANAQLVHADKFGELYRVELDNDEPLVMVKVINSTMEPDGSFKSYFLRVPPTVRTAQEAVAWTFGMSVPQDYGPLEES